MASGQRADALEKVRLYEIEVNPVQKTVTFGRRQHSERSPRLIFDRIGVDYIVQWLTENVNHLYPSTEEKILMAKKCKLTVGQIHSWFRRLRRDISLGETVIAVWVKVPERISTTSTMVKTNSESKN